MDKVQKRKPCLMLYAIIETCLERNIVLHNVADVGFNSLCCVFRNIPTTILNSEAQLFVFKGF